MLWTVIVILVVSPTRVVRQVCTMKGRSVFAKFKDRTELSGLSLDELKRRAEAGEIEGGLARAVSKAIEQIENVKDPADARTQGTAGILATA